MARVFRKFGFSTAMKPHRTLRNILVHPKDKLLTNKKAEVVYEIPCADCPKSYVGETGRSFGVRLQEHQKEVQKFESKQYTRSTRKSSMTDQHKSAITDHVVATNHNIAWEEANIVDRESDKTTRWIKEAIWIRRRGENILNKDEGAYKLHNIFDQLIHTTPSTAADSSCKRSRLYGLSCQSEEAARLAVKRN
ncbi:uncharacterized protein [Ptychodera flava]